MFTRSPRWLKVARDAWLHKTRALLVVASTAVGVLGAGAVLDTWALIRRVTREEYAASNPPSATLRVDSVDAALLALVRQLPDVREAEARRTIVGTARTDGGQFTAVVYAMDDFASTRIGAIKPDGGEWPPRDGAFVMERSSVDYAGSGIGNTVTLQLRDAPPAELPVKGIARDVGLAPGWMEHVVYGFVTRATLATLGVPPVLDEIQVVVRGDALDRDAVRMRAYRVRAAIEAAGHRVSNVNVPEPGRHIHAAQINSLLFTQGAFGLLSLFLSGFLVVNLITALLAGQVREIGVMKAIGASGRAIAAMYLAFALGLGVVASAIAIPLAAVIGRAYAAFTAELLNFSVSGVSIPVSAIAAQVAVGVILPLVAAAIPVSRGCRAPVSDALRDVGIDTSGGGKVFTGSAGFGSLLARRLPRSALFAVRNCFRRRQRTLLTITTLAIGGAVFLGARNLRRAVIGSVDLLYANQRFQMTLRLAQRWKPDTLEVLVRGVRGVSTAEAWSGASGAIRHSDGTLGNSFSIVAPPPATQMVSPAVTRGRWVSGSGARELVVNRALLDEERGLTVDARVDVVASGRVEQWRIVGTTDEGLQPSAYAARDVLSRALGDSGVRGVVVAGSDTSAAGQFALMQRLRDALAANGVVVQSGNLVLESRAAIEDHLLMVVQFLGAMAGLMIVVGGLGLAATMSIAVLERTREIGVLRAIGARHGAIHAVVHGEALAIALAAWLMAIPLSMPMSVVLGRAFGAIMFAVPVAPLPEARGVVLWLAVAVVVSVGSVALPARRATRISARAALAYE